MNILLLTAHSIAEYDDLRMLTDLGYDVFSIGAYSDPANPSDTLRPSLPEAPSFPDLAEKCREQRERHAGESAIWAIDWAKADLHDDVIDWADTIICHHFLDAWIVSQWERLRDKRVIWRTCGQSDPRLEHVMRPLHDQGLQIVRYSPAERRHFERIGVFAGEDAMIRFGKYPSDWYGWTGDDPVVGNITQNMVGRGDACGLGFWMAATEGLPVRPAGPGSDLLPHGIGTLDYGAMRRYLRSIRAYLYTGTQPASYTLGLIEAMMTGVPVVSIGPKAFLPQAPDLFEGREIAFRGGDDPGDARLTLRRLLDHRDDRAPERARAIDLFGIDAIAPQWRSFLGTPVTWRAAVA